MATRQIPWARVLVEGVVIVASILLALAADAWWDGVQERRDERVLLGSLLREFEANAAQLERRITEHDKLRSAGEVLRVLLSSAEEARVSVPDSLLYSVFINTTYDATLGTLAEAQSFGRLGLIENAELRGMLAAWPGLLEDAREEVDRANTLYIENFFNLFGDAVPISELTDRGLGAAWMMGESPPQLHEAFHDGSSVAGFGELHGGARWRLWTLGAGTQGATRDARLDRQLAALGDSSVAMPTRSIPWPRVLAEGFAVVVSILLAFGIQASWEERQERATETGILTALAAEFDANRNVIEARRNSVYQRRAQAQLALLDVVSALRSLLTPSMPYCVGFFGRACSISEAER